MRCVERSLVMPRSSVAIASADGHVFASGGDGVTAVFAGADDAVGAAVRA